MTKVLLIADDSPQKIVLLQHFLHKAKWNGEIVTAETSEEAMTLIDEKDIGFAFIDYYIPSENGPAIIAYLKGKHPSAHAALVSSSDKKSNFDEATAAGAEACLCTTYQADEVEKAVMEVIEEWK
ncbi:MAG TPA: response regulator [Candidatus Peribacteraceae bacterium]|nr:response regulator [Candidatus Peribacteraceae bacterium]